MSEISQKTAVMVRDRLHQVQGLLRQNLVIQAFELVQTLSERMDAEYYNDSKDGAP